jgi:hypothetical protein
MKKHFFEFLHNVVAHPLLAVASLIALAAGAVALVVMFVVAALLGGEAAEAAIENNLSFRKPSLVFFSGVVGTLLFIINAIAQLPQLAANRFHDWTAEKM